MSVDIFDLAGKVAIVTGGSRGLGKAMVLGLAQAGADVAVVSRTLSDLEKVADEIRDLGRDSLAVAADVTKLADVKSMVEKVLDKFGKVDILINNAGTTVSKPALDHKEDDWDKVLDVNLKGYFLCAQAVGKEMVKCKKGSIINNSSMAGVIAIKNIVAYDASKAGVNQLTKALALEWAEYGVRVNAICPGFMENVMARTNEALEKRIAERTPLGRRGKINELIGPVVFLASNASSYITGAIIMVDGCTRLGVFMRIALPLTSPALITVAILAFFTTWNEFLFGVTFIMQPAKWVGTVGIASFITAYITSWQPMMAHSVLYSIIPILVFLFLRPYFVRGITEGF